MSVVVRIDIVSDVMCPWCAIGYASLSRALEAMNGQIQAEIHWQPFELNPDMAAEGQNLREHLQEKYGSTEEESKAVRQRITDMGTNLGFAFNFTDDMRIYNTFDAHQLLHWAGNSGKQTELKMAFFNAYFSEGKDVSNRHVLVAIAQQVGFDGEEARKVLEEQRYAADIRNKQQQWQESGIRSVPAIILDQKYLLSGAQPPESYVKALTELIFIQDEE